MSMQQRTDAVPAAAPTLRPGALWMDGMSVVLDYTELGIMCEFLQCSTSPAGSVSLHTGLLECMIRVVCH